MKISILTLLLFICFDVSCQTKLYRNFNSGTTKEQVYKIAESDSQIERTDMPGRYKTQILNTKAYLSFSFNTKNQLYSINFISIDEFPENLYTSNIPAIVDDFSEVISRVYGKPIYDNKTPNFSDIRYKGHAQVKQWSIKPKLISIDIEQTTNPFDSKNYYYVRMSLLDLEKADQHNNGGINDF